MSKRRVRSVRAARRVIRTMRPDHAASKSSRVISTGRGVPGVWTMMRSTLALPMMRNPPSLSAAMRGQRRLGKMLPARAESARLQPLVLGAAQHLRDADADAAEAVADLLAVAADTLEAQQHDQRSETGIAGGVRVCVSVHGPYLALRPTR